MMLRLVVLAAGSAAWACGGAMSGSRTPEAIPTLAQVTPGQWQRLAGRRLFFGHQSVGGNLMDGVQEVLAANPGIPLRVVETADPSRMKAPGLYHARIGQNGAPATKLEAFRNIVADGVADSGTALLKYCYVDITPDTDPVALFDAYRRTVDSLKVAHPALTVVHVTLPLVVDRGAMFHWRTVLRGNTSDRQLNLTRERYNQLMRETYGGREPVFDLARLESIDLEGRDVGVTHKGLRVPTLAPQWTSDGGHLNQAGRRRIAEAFLATLAGL
jgi:hypothetical protein